MTSITELGMWLGWSLGMMELYESRLAELGDDPQMIHSPQHEDARRQAMVALGSIPAAQAVFEEVFREQQ